MNLRRLFTSINKNKKEFARKFFKSFASSMGLISAIMAVIMYVPNGHQAIIILMLSVIFSVIFASFGIGIDQIDSDSISPGKILDHNEYVLRCPCNIEISKRAEQLSSYCFSDTVTISEHVFEQFKVKNSMILACLIDKSGELLGYFDIIPLDDEFARQFIAGTVQEDDINHEHVISEALMHDAKYVFISGLAVWNPASAIGRRAASILVWGLLKYIKKFYGTGNAKIFAVASKPEGIKILEKFHLKKESDGKNRKDKYSLYSIDISMEAIDERLSLIADWSSICKLDWDGNITSIKQGRPRRTPTPRSKGLRNKAS